MGLFGGDLVLLVLGIVGGLLLRFLLCGMVMLWIGTIATPVRPSVLSWVPVLAISVPPLLGDSEA